jgi:DNA-binding CsgD family transcriptional regulator
LDGAEHEDVSVSIGVLQYAQPPVALRIRPSLSEREVQILVGLVKGHATKLIGRTCDVCEATVKAHMKSILRKIGAGTARRRLFGRGSTGTLPMDLTAAYSSLSSCRRYREPVGGGKRQRP